MKELRVTSKADKVVFSTREWEGIGRPDYEDVDSMDVDAAERFVELIQIEIGKARSAAEANKLKRIKQLEQEIEQRRVELAALITPPGASYAETIADVVSKVATGSITKVRQVG